MTSKRSRVLVSPWLFPLSAISLAFAATGVGIVLQPNMDIASILIGWLLIVGGTVMTVFIVLSRIAVFSADGFRTLNRRTLTPWTEILWADVERETYGILPNWVVVMTCDKRGSDGRHLQIALDGLASFSRHGRLARLKEEIDSWIEEANPGRQINPWLRRPRS